MKDEQKDLLRRIRRNIAMRASDPQSDVRTSQALRADANAIEAALKEVEALEGLVSTIRGGCTMRHHYTKPATQLTEYGKGGFDKESEVLAYVDQFAPPETPNDEG